MRSSDGLPTVAIVGRQNVGKSTLFNRMIRRRRAVVHDEAGVTRDRNYARARWDEREFWLVDTGGFTLWEGHGIELEVQEQVEAAISSLLRTDYGFVVTEAGGCAVDIDSEEELDAARAREMITNAIARAVVRLPI